jgi:RNA polymerase sigma factor (sigma-70 family)
MSTVLNEHAPDADLWQLVRQGSIPAFEVLVRRHQSAVCAVAYNACGDLALSEDVAQETFWTAWRQRAVVEQPERLRAWLCGIARNLGKNARRRAARVAGPLGDAADLSAAAPGPAEQAVSREEEALVWQALAEIPDAYREPLILFYREGQAVAEVAEALGLSPDAVKQRLSRGRGMLRDRVAELVEGTLRRSRPGRSFAVGVLSGLTSAAAKGAGATLTGVVGTGVSVGVLGGVLGALGGLAGGWLGTWLPAQLAPTKGEREHLRRAGRRTFLVSVVFVAVLIGGLLLLAGRVGLAYYLIFWAAWMVTFGAYIAIESVRASRALKRLRALAPAEPNDAPLRVGLEATAARYRGRVYRSRATLFGLPLIDINVRDPLAGGERQVARGWVAVGDDARGLLLAVGATARGFIAVGGRAVGVLSVGGMAAGLVAFGGLAVGGLAVGGLGVGVLALGGLAVGWQAAGGGAFAWDVACGGGAAAWHAAYGGGALAHEYAVGGAASALHANDDAARAVLLDHPLVQGMQWYMANSTWLLGLLVLLSLLGPLTMIPLLYRRTRGD